jgi:glycogen(starch) synthase
VGLNRFEHFEAYRARYARSVFDQAADLLSHSHFDVIHVHDWFSAEAALSLRDKFGLPCVSTVHMLPLQMAVGGDLRRAINRPIEFSFPNIGPADKWQERVCQAADAVIAVSLYMRDATIRQYGIPAERVYTVYNGVSEETIARAARREALLQNPRYAFLANPSTRVVLLPGRLHPQKGIDLLLKSVPSVLESLGTTFDLRWVVCGGGGIMDEILRRYAPLLEQCHDRVIFTGNVSREEALGWIAASDVVVAPSRYEPFGLGVLEAMLLAKPVIAAKCDGLAELVEDGVTGIALEPALAPDGWREVDPASLADAQVHLLAKRARADALGQRARERACARFGFNRFIQDTVAVYDLFRRPGQVCLRAE